MLSLETRLKYSEEKGRQLGRATQNIACYTAIITPLLLIILKEEPKLVAWNRSILLTFENLEVLYYKSFCHFCLCNGFFTLKRGSPSLLQFLPPNSVLELPLQIQLSVRNSTLENQRKKWLIFYSFTLLIKWCSLVPVNISKSKIKDQI